MVSLFGFHQMADEKIVILTNQKSERIADAAKSLGLAGYQAEILTNSESLHDCEKPVLIIKDVSNFDAHDVDKIRSVTKDEKFRSIPVLVIGEMGESAASVSEMMNAGAGGYLQLPIDPLLFIRKITQFIERKRSEKTLGDPENCLHFLIENGADIITVINTKGEIIYESPSVENRLGHKSQNLVGKHCLEFIHPDDHRMISEYYEESVRRIAFPSQPLRYRFKHKNGSWRVLESICAFVTDHSGKRLIVVNSRDVTRRRSEEKARERLESKLIEAEKRFKLALKTSRMVWWEWNPPHDRITLADNFSDIYGAPNIKIAQDGFALLHPDDRERHVSLVRKIAENGGSYHSEFRIIREDNGEIVWLEENASAFLDEENQIQKVVGIAVDVTERKKSENALRESEERFKTQYRELPVPAYTWQKSGDDFILTDYNKIAQQLSGGKIAEYLGARASKLFADLPKLCTGIKECFEQKKSISFEMPYPSRLTNEVKQLIFNLAYIQPDFVMIYTLDVTEFRQTINSLKTSENRFLLVSQATNDVLWDWDLKNDSVWWNENISQIFGHDEEKITTKVDFWYENIHPAEAKKVIDGINKVISGEQNFWSAEYRFRQGDGSYAYVFDRGYVERDKSGQAVRMIGAMMNMTKRKWAEIELLESKDRLAIAQQVAKIGSFELNLQTGKLITSKQLEDIYAAAPNFNNDIEYWMKFVHPEDVESVRKNFLLAQETGELNYEFRIYSSDGKLHWIQCHLKTFYDENNQPQRLIGVNMDITRRKFAEEALRKSQEQLAQSQKLESVGRLAGGIAHDFNNMLTAINGYSELILKSLKEDDPIRRKVVEIKKAGERSVDLTRQLLAFSRRQILQPKLIDLNQVITDMSQLLKRLIGEDIHLTINLYKDNCCILADPGQISQVIMDLAVNARDAMPEGGKLLIEAVNIHVDEKYASKYTSMEIGNYVMLTVKDSGIGIDEENLQFIFEPFFTTKKSGTGLGLSTVYGIIKQSGGYIRAESQKGKGSAFTVLLPQIKEKTNAEKASFQEKIVASGNEKILLVEDEESVRKLLSQVLRNYGYHITEASNGVEALKICRENKLEIDLAITDVVMPKMGGHMLSDELAKIYPHLKVLFISGYVGDKTLLGNKIIPDKNFVPKPIAPDILASRVRQILDRKK